MTRSVIKDLLHFLSTLQMAAIIAAGFSVPVQSAAVQAGEDNAGLTLPEGFSATVVADDLGHARNLVVTPEQTLYIRLGEPVKGQGILVLQESGNKAGKVSGFGDFGGTGLFLRDGYLYTSSDTEVFRYKLNGKHQVINPKKPQKIVTGLLDRGQHSPKAIAVDNDGHVYVNIGAPSNACQEKDRTKGSPGMKPCPLLERSGGIWQFKTDVENQSYDNGVRYATGLRNVVGMDWNEQHNQLYVMQHGRDQLHSLFPNLFTTEQSAVLPAETMYALNRGDNAGWPYMYYDHLQKKKILMPEYGGNGKIEADKNYIDPVAAYPGHLAPNGLQFYTGRQFPERYKNGAFIAFHGSWNRAPEPQAGYYVVFQPFRNGKPSGDWEVFADGFSGSQKNTETGQAEHRPCGLALGPDGSLYVSDDVKGRIYKISYKK